MNHPKSFTQQIPGTDVSFDMIFIEGGSFMMGNDDSEKNWHKPTHQVTVPGFYLGKHLVTQEVWTSIFNENPSTFKGKNRPIESVSWETTLAFIEALNRKTSKNYRLPSEAEWEYAARGGKFGKRSFQYSGSDNLKEVGWYKDNSHEETKPVGLKLPNQLGIFDMTGNVWEWCADVWHDNFENAPTDGSAWMEGGHQNRRVARGGAWSSYRSACFLYFRERYNPDVRYIHNGFRFALSVFDS
mgnify:FL=1